MTTTLPAYNRLGIDYRQVPARKIGGPVIDAHMHTHDVELTRAFLIAAEAYGISRLWTMAPLEDVDALHAAFPGKFEFIAVPKWQNGSSSESFFDDWLKRLDGFYAKGSRLFKIHAAPGTKAKWKVDLEHPQIRRVIEHAYGLGFHFMTHVGDPKAWFRPGKNYGKIEEFGTFESQFEMLDRLLAEFPDRIHLGAHMGGSLEELPALAGRLDRFPQYVIDSSATKWIVRAVAEQDANTVREFIIKYQDRILFGSDIVVGDKFNFDHYASRYWTHLKLWETDYRGESPIEDPDADGPPRLVGLDLPADVLEKLYRKNAERWLPVAAGK